MCTRQQASTSSKRPVTFRSPNASPKHKFWAPIMGKGYNLQLLPEAAGMRWQLAVSFPTNGRRALPIRSSKYPPKVAVLLQ